MEHTDAIATQATERYLLGELNDTETNAFEEHYFDCHLCAEDVRSGMAFFEGGRQLVREEPAPIRVVPIAEHRRRRWGWTQVAVAAMLAYPITFVPLLMRSSARVAAPVIVLSSPVHVPVEVRAGAREAITVTGNEPVLFNVPADVEYPSYQVRVLDPDGKALKTQGYKHEQTTDGLALTIHGVEPGVYQLSISAGEPLREIDRIPVVVKH